MELNHQSRMVKPWSLGAILKGNFAKDKPKMPLMPDGGILGLPVEFLISPDEKIKAAHYGTHAGHHWTVDEMISLATA